MKAHEKNRRKHRMKGPSATGGAGAVAVPLAKVRTEWKEHHESLSKVQNTLRAPWMKA